MDTGQITRADLLQLLAQREVVAFRMAIRCANEPGLLHTLLVETMPDDAMRSAPVYQHDYGDMRFAAGTAAGSDVAQWLGSGGGSLCPDSTNLNWRFTIPELTDSTVWNRRPSYSFDGYVTLPWPYTRYDFNFKQYPYMDQHVGMLISDPSPFFPNFQAAILSLVYGMRDWQRVPGPATDPRVVFRFATSDGQLQHITISPTAVHVHVIGNALADSQLVVSGPPTLEHSQPVGAPGEYVVPLPNEVPTPLWVVLARGNDWLDYYHRDTRWNLVQREQANVTLDPGDLATEIEALIYQGEGVTTEFKANIPSPHVQMLKTVAAFANGEGGVILLGVKDRTGELVGIREDMAGLKDTITNMVRSNLTPEPEIRFAEGTVDHRKILALYILEGDVPPYGIDPRPEKTTYYVRRGATTFPARAEEIRAVVLARGAAKQRQLPYLS